jgi:hypothetical protein
MEYAPPEFQFTGLQFNPNFFDEPLLEPTGGGSVPDPLIINELDTNLIQAKVPASPVSLYENALFYVNLGWSSLPELNLTALASILRTDQFAIQDLTDTCKMIFDTAINTASLTFFPNTGITGFRAGSIVGTNASVPTADDQGTMQITGGILSTPLTIVSNAISSTLNLFNTQTGIISIGNGLGTIRLSNTITSQLTSAVQNLFTTTTGNIFLGGSLTNSLIIPNTITSATVANNQDLFTTTTADINLGGTSTTKVVVPNTITSATLANNQNLFTTTTGDIFLGNSTASSTSQLNLNAQNNGLITMGGATNRTADIQLLNGTSCSGDLLIGEGTSFGGQVRIATNTNALNTITIGTNVFSSMLIRGINYSNQSQNINLNTGSGTGVVNISNGTSSGNVNIGNSATANVNTLGVVNTNISGSNNTNIGSGTNTGTVTIGNINSTNVYIRGPVNINTTGLTATNIGTDTSSGVITIGNSSATLNIGKPIIPTYAYSSINGSNIIGAIGYVQTGSLINNAGTLTAGAEYNMGSTVITEGVWYVSCTIGYRVNTGTSNIQQTELWLATSAVDNDWTGQLGGGNVVSVRTSYLSTSGLWCVATGSSGTLRIKFKVHYINGTVIQENSRWAYQLVRIA